MEPGIYYANKHPTHLFKLIGDLRFDKSQPLYEIIEKLQETQQLENLTIDLTEARFLDSTMLGVLCELGLLFTAKSNKKPIFICENNDIKKMIDSLGLNRIFNFSDAKVQESQWDVLHANPDKSLLKKGVLQAHETLVKINKKNTETFSEVVKTLKEEDKRP